MINAAVDTAAYMLLREITMPKNIQIPSELFFDLCEYFLDQNGDDQLAADISAALSEKLNKIVNHDLFSQYKRTPTGAERERLRQDYLNRRGISDNFRTDQEVNV